MRRIIVINNSWMNTNIAFSNLEKAMQYLEKEHKIIFTESYRTITEKLKYEHKIVFKSHNGFFGDTEHTMQRIRLH